MELWISSCFVFTNSTAMNICEHVPSANVQVSLGKSFSMCVPHTAQMSVGVSEGLSNPAAACGKWVGLESRLVPFVPCPKQMSLFAVSVTYLKQEGVLLGPPSQE